MKTISDITALLTQSTVNLSANSIDTVKSILTNNTPDKDDINTTVRKVDYRDIEYSKLMTINSTINIIYYTSVVALFILLYSENNLLLKERFLFYILLLLIPYLYPWIYMLIQKLWKIAFPEILTQGPKNAFLNNIDPTLPNYTNMPYNV
jgi:hypothetical protein